MRLSPIKCNARFLSLRSRLIVLLLVMILPFIAFSVYKAFDIHKRLEQEAKKESLSIARNVAHEIDEYIVSTGEMLTSIAGHQDARSQNFAALKAWLDEILPKYPYYHLIAFVDTEGYVRTAAMTDVMAKSEDAKQIQLSVKDTACYRRGIISKGVAVGDFMYSKLSGMPVVHVTYPVFDYSGKRIGFIAAAFDLTKIQKKLMNSGISKQMLVAVFDDKGVVVARSKDPKKWVGRNLSNQMGFKGMLGLSEGTGKTENPDGSTRVFSFAALSEAPWFVRAGVDYKVIQSQVNAELANHFKIFIPLLLIAIFGWSWIGKDVDKLHKKTEHLSLIDPLTGLWNYRRLDQDIEKDISHARRYKEELSFAMIDIDHFKHYNDHNGHQHGDDALRMVANVILYHVRDVDSVYRYGGEELCVIMPKTDKQGALLAAERIREAIEKASIAGEEKQPLGKLTVSIGVAMFPHDSISKGGLIKCADIALYDAKNKGRNRVEAFGEVDQSQTAL